MIANRAELVMRRKQVRAFIDADYVKISMMRKSEPTKSPAGGYLEGTVTVLAPQKARIVQNKRRFNAGLINSEAGDIPHTDYLLLGNHNLNAEVEDQFLWLGDNYKIKGIFGARTESFLATIDFLGPVNR